MAIKKTFHKHTYIVLLKPHLQRAVCCSRTREGQYEKLWRVLSAVLDLGVKLKAQRSYIWNADK